MHRNLHKILHMTNQMSKLEMLRTSYRFYGLKTLCLISHVIMTRMDMKNARRIRIFNVIQYQKKKLMKSVNLHILLLQIILSVLVFCFHLFNLFPAKSVKMCDLFTFFLKATLKGLQSICLRY